MPFGTFMITPSESSSCDDSRISTAPTYLTLVPSACLGLRIFAPVWDRVPAAGPVRDSFRPVAWCVARSPVGLGTNAVDCPADFPSPLALAFFGQSTDRCPASRHVQHSPLNVRGWSTPPARPSLRPPASDLGSLRSCFFSLFSSFRPCRLPSSSSSRALAASSASRCAATSYIICLTTSGLFSSLSFHFNRVLTLSRNEYGATP